MTRVCVEWSRPETARLIARCREALDEPVPNRAAFIDAVCAALRPLRSATEREVAAVAVDAIVPLRTVPDRGALSVVLDGIAATLSRDYQSSGRDVANALASLTAIAAALGVQEEAS